MATATVVHRQYAQTPELWLHIPASKLLPGHRAVIIGQSVMIKYVNPTANPAPEVRVLFDLWDEENNTHWVDLYTDQRVLVWSRSNSWPST